MSLYYLPSFLFKLDFTHGGKPPDRPPLPGLNQGGHVSKDSYQTQLMTGTGTAPPDRPPPPCLNKGGQVSKDVIQTQMMTPSGRKNTGIDAPVGQSMDRGADHNTPEHSNRMTGKPESGKTTKG